MPRVADLGALGVLRRSLSLYFSPLEMMQLRFVDLMALMYPMVFLPD